MYKQKKCIAMLLAGGQGTRLLALTMRNAKPAIPFGAKYRIIDFPLSNCAHSKIDTVGVITQYQPQVLNDYIGNGQPWDLDRTFGGVHILSPYQAKNRADWYKGTANTVYQNLDFVYNYEPEHVLILSGDQIYKMDYSEMLQYHIEKDADCTIATLEVTLEDAKRFGIMNTDEDNVIYEFEEKPAHPKSTKASMGIYIFKRDKLLDYLIADNEDPNTNFDFGKNIIPNMLKAKERMVAFPFKGYWKDVGTVESLWSANMDLIGEEPAFDIYDPYWKIYSRNIGIQPQYLGSTSNVVNSLIAGGCVIEGTVINSVIGAEVKVAKGAVIKDSVIFSDVTILENATVNYSIIDEHVTIGKSAIIGNEKKDDSPITVIGRDLHIADQERVSGIVNPKDNVIDNVLSKKGV